MKRLISLIYIFFFLLFSKIVSANATLHVNILDCREETSFEFIDSFNLYKGDSLFKKFEAHYRGTVFIENLESGKYYIEFINWFGKITRVDVEIGSEKNYYTEICLNQMDYERETHIPIINQLEEGESYSILMLSHGCFHSTKDSLFLSKKDESYFIKYNGVEKLLKENELTAIRHFEIELNYINALGCTTVDTYLVKFKEKEIIVKDGGCNWRGRYNLLKNLNLLED